MTKFTFEELEGETVEKMRKSCVIGPAADYRCFPSGSVLPKDYTEIGQRVLDLSVRESDVWIISFPKCGTTWTQEMAWLLGNKCDTEAAKSSSLEQRCPFLELSGVGWRLIDTVTQVEQMASPRFIKSHLPPELLPRELWTKKPKIVYVYRNPKDVILSYFSHYKTWKGYQGTKEEFVDAFLEDKVEFSPFWEHVLSYWKLQGELNILFNTYEEMKSDLAAVLRKTAKFLEADLPEESVPLLLDHLSFESMKNNPMVNYDMDRVKFNPASEPFMRSGEAGQWKKALDLNTVLRLDNWSKPKLKDTGFPYY